MMHQDLFNYLEPISFLQNEELYLPNQVGKNILQLHSHADIAHAQIIIVGCAQQKEPNNFHTQSVDSIRKEFYAMYNWHAQIIIADAGNIIKGATPTDTEIALTEVLTYIHAQKKIAIVLGGTHKLTLAQYGAFNKLNEVITATVVDMLIDLDNEEEISEKNFLMHMLTSQPNYVRNFNAMAFQSYYVNPSVIETLDKLHFDCYRLGKMRENLLHTEPIMRATDLLSIDINAVKQSDAPSNIHASPNGLQGDELCQITRYAGMSDKCCSLGIYGYNLENDTQNLSAKLIAQALWYFVDGVHYKQTEALFTDKQNFTEYNVNMHDGYTLFLQSKRTNRWWMQLPNRKFVPCNEADYIQASQGYIPELWLREMDRSV